MNAATCPDCKEPLADESTGCASCATSPSPKSGTVPVWTANAGAQNSDATADYRTPPPPAPPKRTPDTRPTMALPKDSTAPPNISGYTILGRLGEGGMGAVFLAEDDALKRKVAIKVISNPGKDSIAEARFLREARSMATAEHPNIVRVLSFGTVDDQPYLVMELVDGESLADRIKRQKRFTAQEALKLVRPVVEALAASWQKGIHHRDIKPSNILIDKRGTVRVADFGLAKPAVEEGDSELTATGHMVGSPYYMAPEQATGSQTDFRTDMYSLGIVLYELLAGERPFIGKNALSIVAKHIQSPLPPLTMKRTDLPPLVVTLVERMTAKNPQQRHASYALLLRDIDRILNEGATTMTSIPAVVPSAMLEERTFPIKWLVAGAVAIVVLLVVMLVARRQPSLRDTVPATQAVTQTTATSGTTVDVRSATPAAPPAVINELSPTTITTTQAQPAVVTQAVMPAGGVNSNAQQEQLSRILQQQQQATQIGTQFGTGQSQPQQPQIVIAPYSPQGSQQQPPGPPMGYPPPPPGTPPPPPPGGGMGGPGGGPGRPPR